MCHPAGCDAAAAGYTEGMYADTPVAIEAGDVTLEADLSVPEPARGVVLFAHGSGSSRHSPRNRMVAARLCDSGFATVLADLLTLGEERFDEESAALRFDIGLLSRRLVGVVDWLGGLAATRELPVGLFGASTGAAAALVAAADRPDVVSAVVSRGGRPDLAGEALHRVRAPTLMIVGGADRQVLRLNEDVAEAMSAPHQLRVVPGASHLFGEPGALEQVATWAASWFAAYLAQDSEAMVDEFPEVRK
jgi:putative phosphoribosyl transferase